MRSRRATARVRRGGLRGWRRPVPVAVVLLVLVGIAALGIKAGQLPTPTAAPIARPTPPPADDDDLYVSAAGSDSASGQEGDPLATIQAAADRAAPGSTIWLAPGSYQGVALTRSGRPGAPITIAGMGPDPSRVEPGPRSVTIDLVGVHDITLVDLDVEGPDGSALTAVRLEESHGIEILGSKIHDTLGGFGIDVRFSSDVTIRGNDIGHNGVGVRLYGEGDPGSVDNVVVEGNALHDADSLIVDDPAPDNDFGANAIIWHKVTGSTVARDNQVWANRASSHDYGTDGGAFEIWASSNMLITGNTVWDNVNVVETGTDGAPCANITFARNVAFVTTRGVGLILRCAEDSLIANNVLDRMEHYAFELSDASSGNHFAGSISGLQIVNNIVVGSQLYSVVSSLPDSLRIDHNLAWRTDAPVAHFPAYGSIGTLEELARTTGYDVHGISADPRFVDRDAHDYRITAGSPALDAGQPTSLAEEFTGAAPDIGRYEGPTDLPSASPSAG
jgi:hypothetical protein